jgi:hypothetical protein
MVLTRRVDIQSNLKASNLLQATETIFGELVEKIELRTYEVLVKGRANNDTKTSPMVDSLIRWVYFEKLHGLVRNTIPALFEPGLTWDLRDRVEGPPYTAPGLPPLTDPGYLSALRTVQDSRPSHGSLT